MSSNLGTNRANRVEINIELNGRQIFDYVNPAESLRTWLRRQGMFSVKYGSESGETGAGAILFDGRLASSDVILAAQASGHAVTTVESLNTSAELHPVQAAFAAVGAMQSGYSAGAMILGTLELLEQQPSPTEAEIRDMLSGILDRETAYVKVVEAIQRAAATMRGEATEPFGPLILEPMTDGVHAVEYDPTSPRPEAPQSVPRLIPSRDVPDMAVVGKPEIKVDAVKLAKGNPAFTDDIELRDMLYAKLLTSPHAHANIVDIDDSRARAVPGVVEILHYQNTPRVKYASGGQSWPNPHPHDQVSFDTKVRHVGDRVAVVAAETIEAAEAACALIDVTYEVLPAIFDERDAMADGAPVIHDEQDTTDIFDRDRNVVHEITKPNAAMSTPRWQRHPTCSSKRFVFTRCSSAQSNPTSRSRGSMPTNVWSSAPRRRCRFTPAAWSRHCLAWTSRTFVSSSRASAAVSAPNKRCSSRTSSGIWPRQPDVPSASNSLEKKSSCRAEPVTRRRSRSAPASPKTAR